jgi:phage tail-like protein
MAYSRGPDPSPSFRFHIEIEGIEVARFSECNGIDFETEVFDYKEGGLNSRLHRFPGRWKFSNLNLKKGIATDGQPLWDWVQNVVKGANTGEFPTHPVTVTLYDVSGKNPLRTWTYKDAYPIKWAATALSADQNAIAIETLTLAHQGMDFSQ